MHFWRGLLVGAVLGSLAGLLVFPQLNDDTQERLGESTRRVGNQARRWLRRGGDRLEQAMNQTAE